MLNYLFKINFFNFTEPISLNIDLKSLHKLAPQPSIIPESLETNGIAITNFFRAVSMTKINNSDNLIAAWNHDSSEFCTFFIKGALIRGNGVEECNDYQRNRRCLY